MFKNITQVAVAASLLAGAAHAATVNVDFDGGSSVNVRTVPITYGSGEWAYQFPATTGVWQENGVNTRWQSYSDLLFLFGDNLTPDYWTNLSDQDPGADPTVTQFMEVSRADGGLFNLSRIGTGHTYEGLGAYAQFDPDPGVDVDPAYVVAPIFGTSLSITGVKEDGSVVDVNGVTKTIANWLPDYDGYGGYPAVFSALDVQLGSAAMAALTNLKSMTIAVAPVFYVNPLMERAALIKTLVDIGAPPVLLDGALNCGYESYCHIDGLGEFVFFSDIMGGRNDIRNVSIADFDIEFVGGPGPQPAPVPLPATALLLLGGIGALGAARFKRKS